jgi:phosphinothricin acetyltransferase
MDCIIREMTEADWDRVRSIYMQAIIEGMSTFQTECPSYNIWDESHKKDCRLAAVADGIVVGWCALSATSSREAYRGVVEVSIYIDQKYRNLGIGTRLLKELCTISKDHGYWCLYASIFSINSASIELHRKCGFREIGYRKKIAKDRFGVWQDTTLMELRNSIY